MHGQRDKSRLKLGKTVRLASRRVNAPRRRARRNYLALSRWTKVQFRTPQYCRKLRFPIPRSRSSSLGARLSPGRWLGRGSLFVGALGASTRPWFGSQLDERSARPLILPVIHLHSPQPGGFRVLLGPEVHDQVETRDDVRSKWFFAKSREPGGSVCARKNMRREDVEQFV